MKWSTERTNDLNRMWDTFDADRRNRLDALATMLFLHLHTVGLGEGMTQSIPAMTPDDTAQFRMLALLIEVTVAIIK